jgi:hypothetical protein
MEGVYFYLGLEVYSYLGLRVYSYCLTVKDIISKVIKLIYIRAERG